MSLKLSTIKAFVQLKQLTFSFREKSFCYNPCQIRLRSFSKREKMKEKNFVGIENRLNLSSYKTL